MDSPRQLRVVFLPQRRWLVVPDTAGCSTEKVHGSNLALVVEAGDGGAAATAPTVRIARRRGFIAPGEDFFGLTGTDGLGLPAGATAGGDGGLQARLEAMALKAFTAWRGAAAGERDVMWIYGELFGGMYPHEDVEEDPARRGRAPVQRGVYYCPELRFMVFDIGKRNSTAVVAAASPSSVDARQRPRELVTGATGPSWTFWTRLCHSRVRRASSSRSRCKSRHCQRRWRTRSASTRHCRLASVCRRCRRAQIKRKVSWFARQ